MTSFEVLAMHDLGHTPAQIAATMGITQHRVESILDRDAAEAGPLTVMAEAPAVEPLDTAGPYQARTGPRKDRWFAPNGYTHGTPYGYRAHKRDGETPCEACHTAAAAKWAVARERRKAAAS